MQRLKLLKAWNHLKPGKVVTVDDKRAETLLKSKIAKPLKG